LDWDEADRIGRDRNAAHAGNSTPRFFADPDEEDRIGARGEMCFATAFGLDVDRAVRVNGDEGVDFRVCFGARAMTIDVKTFRNPIHLLVKQAELVRGAGADVYVLAHCDRDAIVLVGWETRSIMALMPVAEFGYGIVSHYRLRDELRPMAQLLNLLAMRSRTAAVLGGAS